MNLKVHGAGERGGALTWQRWLALLALLCLLVSLGRFFATNMGTLMSVMVLFPLSAAFAALVLKETRLYRQPEFILLLAFAAAVLISSAVSEKLYGTFVANRNYLGTLATSLFVCYALCFALPKETRARTLHAFIGVSTAVVAAACLLGVILAARGDYLVPRFMPEYGIGLCPPEVGMGADWRLVVFTHPNTVGMVCEIVLLLCAYRIITLRNTLGRVLYGVAAAICFAALALAASRTSSLALSAGLAMVAFRLLWGKLKDRKPAARWLACIAAAAVTAVACFVLLDLLCGALLSLSPEGSSLAAAETAAERVIADETGAFSGRTRLWSGVLACMQDTPYLFAVGTSPVQVGQVIAPYTPIWVQEVHSSLVQMLISCGIPCLLLFAAFTVLLAVKGVRVFFAAPRAGAFDAGWLVPVLVAVLISASMETFLALYPQLHFANLWFFLAAGYVVCAANEQKAGADA